MATTKEIFIRIGSEFSEVFGDLDKLQNKLKRNGEQLTSIGKKMSVGITLPLAAMGAGALAMSTDFNAAMANVATLIPGNIERVQELKSTVQDMAVGVGKSTDDLAGGLFQVISAFGDSAETAQVLQINAEAAAAGLATTTDAINLTSAVTKAYGDTSAEAVQRVADLAFQTNKLGQTTFPEMAATMGRVVPLAKALNVTQEELFGSMATLTGVTGNTAEVTTQLRATYQAILKPTKDMSGAILRISEGMIESGELTGPLVDQLNELKREFVAVNTELDAAFAAGDKGAAKELEKQLGDISKQMNEVSGGMGAGIVQAKGFQETLKLIAAEADGNSNKLGQLFGSVEAIGAVLALTGSQADNLATKTAAMSEVSGAAGEAFKEQSEGINKTGFAMAQAQQKLAVLTQGLGDELAPVMLSVVNAVAPLIQGLRNVLTWFASLDEGVKQTVIIFTGAFAASGPILVAVGTLMTLLAGITAPILVGGAIIVGIAAGVAAIVANWDRIKQIPAVVQKMVEDVKTWMVDKLQSLIVQPVKEKIEAVTGFFKTMFDKVVGGSFVPDMVRGIGQWMGPGLQQNMVQPAMQATGQTSLLFQQMTVTTAEALRGLQESAVFTFGAIRTNFVNTLVGMIAGTTTFVEFLNQLWQTILAGALNVILSIGLQWALGQLLQQQQAAETLGVFTAVEAAKTAIFGAEETARLGIMLATNQAMLAAVFATIGGMTAVGNAALGILAAALAAVVSFLLAVASAVAGIPIVGQVLAGILIVGAGVAAFQGAAAIAVGAAGVQAAAGTAIVSASTALSGIPVFDSGGITTGPTLAMLSKNRRKEAVIPLDRLESFAGGGETTIIVEMDGRTIMKQIMKHLPGVVRVQGVPL
ncbi:phage tail tape measure protein [Candidatus Nitronereus thalassa]|uniref:Phage tail tape measure protein n=1 Tax=Candidatus Nitronereus thalassa TaxID=3020898 RepID=A0ABU3K3B6_9BACT|nr:phage tail tape measure protein [Candidatus Nitronereus thalassa]MDT7040880.1 phage tail tape measure protein [Candidatus Nitronereus thalassa]